VTDDAAGTEDREDPTRVGGSAVRQLTANVAHVERSAVQRLSAQSVDAANSAVGVANAATIELRNSAAGVAAGDYIRIEESKVFVLLAPRVSGNVKAVLTLPAAFAIGAGYFFARWLAKRAFRRSAA
jgi:uncharacterized protein (DUF169 family)